jgi:hypothetical protein
MRDPLPAGQFPGPGGRRDHQAGGPVGGVGLGAVGHHAAWLGGRQLGQAFGGGRVDAYVAVDHHGLAAPARQRDRHQVTALEGPVVGERGLVLLVTQQGDLVQPLPGQAGLGRDPFGGGHHGQAAPWVAAEAVQDPGLLPGRPAGGRRRRVAEDRAVGGTVGGDHHRQLVEAGFYSQGRSLHAGG